MSTKKSELLKLRGLGPKSAEALQKKGITSFGALAETKDDILLELARDFEFICEREILQWKENATTLLNQLESIENASEEMAQPSGPLDPPPSDSGGGGMGDNDDRFLIREVFIEKATVQQVNVVNSNNGTSTPQNPQEKNDVQNLYDSVKQALHPNDALADNSNFLIIKPDHYKDSDLLPDPSRKSDANENILLPGQEDSGAQDPGTGNSNSNAADAN